MGDIFIILNFMQAHFAGNKIYIYRVYPKYIILKPVHV